MQPRIRVLAFHHPDFDANEPAGFCLQDGQLLAVSGLQAVRQSILLLLSTLPGERLRRPSYGCDLRPLMFQPNDPTTHGMAIHYVRQALERWEPRIEILQLDASANAENPSLMDISLQYRLKASEQRDLLAININLAEAV